MTKICRRKSSKKNTTKIGNKGEEKAAEYLLELGHEIIERNWKCKICEIDIISIKDDEIYFTEVKYRTTGRFGGGIEAIDQKKENQIRLAAEFYLTVNKMLEKIQPHISVISLTGENAKIESYIKDV